MSIRDFLKSLCFTVFSITGIPLSAQDVTFQNYDIKVLEGSLESNIVDPSAALLTEIKTFDFISSSRSVTNQRSGGFQVLFEMFVSIDSILSSDDILFGSKTSLISNFTNSDLGYTFQIRCYDFPEMDGEYFLLDKITLTSRNSSFEIIDVESKKYKFYNTKEALIVSGAVEAPGGIVPIGTDLKTTLTITNNSPDVLNSYEWQFFLDEGDFDFGSSVWLNKFNIKYPEMMEGDFPSQTTRETINPGETKIIRNVPISIPGNIGNGSFEIYALPIDAFNNWIEESNCIDLTPSPIIEILGPTIGFEQDTLKIHSAPLQKGQANIIMKNIGGGTLEWTLPRGCDFVEPIDRNGNIGATESMIAEVRFTAPETDDICSVNIKSNSAGSREVLYPIQFVIVDSMENVTLSVDDDSYCADGKLLVSFFRPPGVVYAPDNKFYIELSESRGYFSFPKVLAISEGADEKTLEITLPAGIDLSRDFAIRMRSTSPAYIGDPTPLKQVIGAGVITESNGILSGSSSANATYRWLFCDNNLQPILGANEPTYKPLFSGSFALEISKSGCVDTTACFDFNFTSSLIELADSDLSIAPNPAFDQISISHKSLTINKVDVISLSGKLIKTFRFNQNQLDISVLPSAIYFIKVYAEEKILIQKIIKQ